MNRIGSLEPRERKLGGGRKKNNREKCYQEKGLRRGRIIREEGDNEGRDRYE